MEGYPASDPTLPWMVRDGHCLHLAEIREGCDKKTGYERPTDMIRDRYTNGSTLAAP